MTLFEKILRARGLDDPVTRAAFLSPDYETGRHDPFLLPDMQAAVDRLVVAREAQEQIMIYGDYDIDGLTATTVLLDAFDSFGFTRVDAFIPNRFVEGYGMTVDAVERIAATGATLILTVDCGSLSHEPIARAKELGMDVIVTDHHNVAPEQPSAVAVINPKRLLQDFPEMYEGFVLKRGNVDSGESAVSSDKGDSVSAGSLASAGVDASRQDNFSDRSLSSAELVVPRQSSPSQELSEKLSGLDGAPAEARLPASPKLYPFLDLPGVGVAFKLVQALQTRLDGLELGQEKWLLDLVALGTVCDVVTLVDENRLHVYWGLKVLARTRRPGLKALMAVARVEPDRVNARSLGFGLGPRMNAAGRLETAQIALDMLRATDGMQALELARQLDDMNLARRAEQDEILKSAIVEAERYTDDPVLVVSAPGWNHGIVGIVAAKLLEKYGKPTFVLAEESTRASGGGAEVSNSLRNEAEGLAPSETIAQHEASAELQGAGQDSEFTSKSQRRGEPLLSKGSARSYGKFSAADAIRAADDIITKGGGHKLAAGVTLPTANIAAFRERVNDVYRQQKLTHTQEKKTLLPQADVTTNFADVTETLIAHIATLEPFGSGNPQPILQSTDLLVTNLRRMGADGQHVKLTLEADGRRMDMLAFSASEHFFVEPGTRVTVWYAPDINEWQGRRSVEGRLLHLEISEEV